ncbi:hypothetical protein PYCCODRAFT_1409741 [Trametes coccinea BRFM310]|uniref:RNA polymerase II subunit A C-terminal domain phosphatase n=1 Tax=Trametes coccinea (strain BRFM310) TaxID=1353009 RepID=A0A1Y2IQJ0_TRAC3|nr:hypothetical protein PYCCODRAFT_1409741 [Trametes coccinea BRFM310]
MSSPTELYLPPSLPYPIKLVSLAALPDSQVQRGSRLLDYSFTYRSPGSDAPPELRFGTWDSSVEGTLTKWNFKQGDTVSERRARETPAVFILEPCKHGVQLGGLCCLCGKDMTSYDYTGFSDASRASIQMTHLANGPLVSLEEAQRIEQETAQHLLRSRKLSLIVDLDQTIVHATVDPTVGEWIAEGEAWETRQAKKAAARADDDAGSKDAADPDKTLSDEDDEVNPNWEALKDVKKFRLGPEVLGPPQRGPRARGKEKIIEQEGCMYYIKPRPGLQEFLQTMATKYEMHVYTMGTRAYAEEVCAAIDPGGKIFGNRILSRDESGSLTQKSLQRLFPCDQSMVVIIDDRADVWEWSPNLVKVIPYDFFVGIGDINSAFLPKLEPLAPVVSPPPPILADPAAADAVTSEAGEVAPEGEGEGDEEDDDDDDDDEELEDLIPSSDALAQSEEDERLAELKKNEILSRNTEALEAQVEERPLAKKQEELQETAAGEAEAASAGQPAASAVPVANGNGEVTAAQQPLKRERPVRKALLKNDDTELLRVRKILETVHERFYEAWEKHKPEDERRKRKHSKRSEPQVDYDVRTIIPRIRTQTLEGCHILFSSVIPLDTRPEATEIWKTAHAFGAKCYTELTPRVTHVVAAKRGTQKVDAARRRGGIKIVWLAWFTDSVALWQRQDETPYLLDPEPRPDAGVSGDGDDAQLASPPSDPHQISSDPEPDADDWDELGEGSAGGGRTRALALEDEVDWDEINDEVEAAMNESDDDGDEGGEGDARSVRSGFSEDESWTDESNSIISSANSTPRRKRKRMRSITPSEAGSLNGADPDVLRSPLAKRKKLAADRSGASRLKEAFTAEELSRVADDDDDNTGGRSSRSSPINGSAEEAGDYGEDYEGTDDEMDDEDDFLARELEEEWG